MILSFFLLKVVYGDCHPNIFLKSAVSGRLERTDQLQVESSNSKNVEWYSSEEYTFTEPVSLMVWQLSSRGILTEGTSEDTFKERPYRTVF